MGGSEGFFMTDTVDSVISTLPLPKLSEDQQAKMREAIGLLAARDFALESFLATVLTGQANSEVITTATGGATITFPHPFRSSPVVVACIGDTATALSCNVVNASITNTEFDVQVWDSAGAEQNGTPVRIAWIATS